MVYTCQLNLHDSINAVPQRRMTDAFAVIVRITRASVVILVLPPPPLR